LPAIRTIHLWGVGLQKLTQTINTEGTKVHEGEHRRVQFRMTSTP
jgi:hypothetical protein